MDNREKVIKGLRCISGEVVWCAHCPYSDVNGSGRGDRCKRDCAKDAIALLKAQEPRVMTLEEVMEYLADPDGDKKPLWLEWSIIPSLSGWVLPSQVADLMKRYLKSYNTKWRPWTSHPTDEQREAEAWS